MHCVYRAFAFLLLQVVHANIIIKVYNPPGFCLSMQRLKAGNEQITMCVVQTGNYTFDPLDDMPADFGPRIPAEGLEGFLIVSAELLLT